MSSSLNLSLTDELRQFVDEHSGNGTLYATPSEFVRDVLRHRKLELEAQKLREGILEGFQDVIDNRLHEFKGDLASIIANTVQPLVCPNQQSISGYRGS
jgi:antitoxin ParD1/3/4